MEYLLIVAVLAIVAIGAVAAVAIVKMSANNVPTAMPVTTSSAWECRDVDEDDDDDGDDGVHIPTPGPKAPRHIHN